MANKVPCPNCRTKLDTSEVLWAQLSRQIRTELEFEFHDGRAAIYKARRELVEKQADFDQEQRAFEQKVQDRIDNMRAKLTDEIRTKVSKSYDLEISFRDQQVIELRKKLEAAQAREWELNRRELDLQNREQELDRAESKIRQHPENLNSKVEAKQLCDFRKMSRELRQQIKNDLERSNDKRGELAPSRSSDDKIEEVLLSAFPADSIEPAPDNLPGLAAVQRVHSANGSECGLILWGVLSDDKFFDNSMYQNLRQNQKQIEADSAILVAKKMPEGVESFAKIDGVWVCHWAWAVRLAAAIRSVWAEVGNIGEATPDNDHSELIYSYLSSNKELSRVGDAIA